MGTNRGPWKKLYMSNHTEGKSRLTSCRFERTNGAKGKRGHRAPASYDLCLTSFVLISLFAFTIAANSAQQWRDENLSLVRALPRVSSLERRPSPLAQSEQTELAGGEQDDSEVNEFLERLLVARRLLDERLGRDVAQQKANTLAAEQLQGSRYELLDGSDISGQQALRMQEQQLDPEWAQSSSRGRADELLAKANHLAAELRLAKLASLSRPQVAPVSSSDLSATRSTLPTNPMFYSVSQDDAVGPVDSEFSGQFGEPLARQLEASKREARIRDKAEDQQQKQAQKQALKYTLLEAELNDDDDEPEAASNSTSAGGKRAKADDSFGRVIVKPSEPAKQQQQQQAAEPGKSYVSALFNRFYDQMAQYLPSLVGAGSSGANSSGAAPNSSSSSDGESSQKIEFQSNRTGAAGHHQLESEATSEKNGDEEDRLGEPRRALSAAIVNGPAAEENNADKDEHDSQEVGHSGNKLVRVRLERRKPDTESAAAKRVHVDASDTLDMSQMWPAALHQQQQQQELQQELGAEERASTVRKFLPAQESLLGKYVYAPSQHYYLAGDAALPAHNLRAGDQVYGSASAAAQWAEQPRAAYAFQRQAPSYVPLAALGGGGGATLERDPNGLGNSRSHASNNDLYFLVMVGAFCIMAMAVVLAAGLFAYRLQQNRKSSQAQQEYPTYGVVGPNNILGAKCGAANFMGGYFATNASQSSGLAAHLSGGSKSASAKRLPELYASDSGLASLDKMCSSKKSSGASSGDHAAAQQQQQQPHQQRQSANNFMTCANSQDAARMYHYQHQKQQMIVSDRSSAGRHTSASDLDSEDDNDDGSYTVYECPGLASAQEMEIKNPLFDDERTP